MSIVMLIGLLDYKENTPAFGWAETPLSGHTRLRTVLNDRFIINVAVIHCSRLL